MLSQFMSLDDSKLCIEYTLRSTKKFNLDVSKQYHLSSTVVIRIKQHNA
jgi:hypothetical protein